MSYGRRKIFTDETEITAENVVREDNAAFLVHTDNRNENLQQAYNRSKVRLAPVLYCSALVLGKFQQLGHRSISGHLRRQKLILASKTIAIH